MNRLVKNAKVKLGLDTSYTDDDAVLALYADDAIDYVNDIRDFTPSDSVPYETRWRSVIEDMIVEAYQRRGSEGEAGSSVNGVSRTWTSTTYSPALVARIPAMIRVL